MFEMFCGFTPFADEEDLEEDAIYMRIIQEDLSVHLDCLEGDLRDVVTQLLERDPDLRIGCRHSSYQQDSILELMHHPFFADVDWEGIEAASLDPNVLQLRPGSKQEQVLARGYHATATGNAGNLVRLAWGS